MGTPETICRSLAGQFTTVLFLEVLQHLTNFYFSFTDCILPCWTLEPGGTQVKMGYSYVPPLRPLFPKTAISEFLLVPQDPTFAWNHKFLENLHFKASKLKKSSVLMPNVWSSFSFTIHGLTHRPAWDVINPRKNPTQNFCKTVGSNDSFTLSWTVMMTVNIFKFKCLNSMIVKKKVLCGLWGRWRKTKQNKTKKQKQNKTKQKNYRFVMPYNLISCFADYLSRFT